MKDLSEKNRLEVKHKKYYSEESLKTNASKKIKRYTKLKKAQEEDNALPHKYVFDVKLENLAHSNADPNEEVMSTVPLESSIKMILRVKRTIKKEVAFKNLFSIYFKQKFLYLFHKLLDFSNAHGFNLTA